MPIRSQDELESYIVQALPYNRDEANRIARSAVFVDGRFRGAGVEFVLFFDELG